jgi:Ribbon-helix-helix protein, copG family
MTVPNKIAISLRLDPDQARLLKLIKARDGVPESEQIRRALVLWFEQKGVLKAKRKS